jgi:hypothetical protein
MNGDFILAFVITPALVVALGWLAVLLHERSLRRSDRSPSE